MGRSTKRLGIALGFLAALGLAACQGTRQARQSGQPARAGPRAVTLRSHLDAPLSADPALRPGERIRFVPAADERTARFNPLDITLPASTPYPGPREQYFLRGYAVGFAAPINQQHG
jgi:hypothetical protein